MPLEPTAFYQTHLAELHQRLLASPIVRTCLTGTGIRLDGVDLVSTDTFDLPFGTFSTVEFAHLFSVFDGSRVHLQAEKSPSFDDAPHLAGCTTVQDVIALDEPWWMAHGTQRRMVFDLMPHSTSWRKPYVNGKISEGSR